MWNHPGTKARNHRNSIPHTNHECKYSTPGHDAKVTGRTLFTAAQHCSGILDQAARRQSEQKKRHPIGRSKVEPFIFTQNRDLGN